MNLTIILNEKQKDIQNNSHHFSTSKKALRKKMFQVIKENKRLLTI